MAGFLECGQALQRRFKQRLHCMLQAIVWPVMVQIIAADSDGGNSPFCRAACNCKCRSCPLPGRQPVQDALTAPQQEQQESLLFTLHRSSCSGRFHVVARSRQSLARRTIFVRGMPEPLRAVCVTAGYFAGDQALIKTQ